MKQAWILPLLLALTLLFSACGTAAGGDSSPAPDATPTQSEQTETPTPLPDATPAQPAEESPSPALPAHVSIDFAAEELLAREEDYDHFIDDDSEYRVQAVFTATGMVTDLRFVALGFEEAEETIRFYVAEELYTAPALTPERPLVIDMAFMGLIPDRGISYLDETGTLHTFTLNMSGMDGSLLLVEEPFVQPQS